MQSLQRAGAREPLRAEGEVRGRLVGKRQGACRELMTGAAGGQIREDFAGFSMSEISLVFWAGIAQNPL